MTRCPDYAGRPGRSPRADPDRRILAHQRMRRANSARHREICTTHSHPLASAGGGPAIQSRAKTGRSGARTLAAVLFQFRNEIILLPRAAVRLRYEAACLCDEIAKPLGEFQALCQLYPPVLLPEQFVLYVLIVRLKSALAAFSRLRITVADPVRWLLKHSTRRPFGTVVNQQTNEPGAGLFPVFKTRQYGRSVAVRSAACPRSRRPRPRPRRRPAALPAAGCVRSRP